MKRQSPPKHRHDGTSPLPLGMDWSPPPRLWAGRETVWPHDPRTGWSYCVTIPSWVVLAKSKDSDPIVFFRVLVGIQSAKGITTTRTVLRRFNDFLKLFAALKRSFPRKKIPPAPPKGILRMKTRPMLEERRSSLEEWMAKLLSDIDLSRSISVASFVELETAARSSFQDEGSQSSELNMSLNTTLPALQVHPNSSSSVVAGSSSLASEYCSDIADETSENETPSLGRDNNSEVETEDPSLDDNLTSPIDTFVKYGMSNIDEGLTMGQIILEKLEGFPKHKLHLREVHNVIENSISNENASKSSYFTGNVLKVLSGPEHGTIVRHARKLSSESLGSDMDSQKDSELSKSTFLNSNGDGQVDFSSEAEISRTIRTLGNTDFELLNDGRLILPLDQGQKMSRVLATMQQRLVVAKTDMEDLITRLNQEISVKDYLNTKVKDLAVELETTKEKGKENLEQAILIERERLTEMQWDMEELRQRSMKMEVKLNSQQGQKLDPEVTKASVSEEKDVLQQELDAKKEELEELLKRHQELEVKSKADIKLLVKEVKSLRSSRAEVKQQLSQSLEEKSAAEDLLKQERKSNEQARTSWRELLHKCKILHDQLKECKVNLMNEIEDNLVTAISSLPDALDLSAMYDNKISLLISEVQHLAQGVDSSGSTTGRITRLDKGTLHTQSIVEELKTMLADILVDNGMLRKQVNSIILYALEMNKTIKKDDSESPSNVTVTE